jgi:Tannase and feruloyl esterase
VKDFGYRAVHETSVQAKVIIRAFYGKEAARSYFVGCSEGGREGLTEAQRYPDDFQGIVAGAPAINWNHLQTRGLWDELALLETPGSYIPPTYGYADRTWLLARQRGYASKLAGVDYWLERAAVGHSETICKPVLRRHGLRKPEMGPEQL